MSLEEMPGTTLSVVRYNVQQMHGQAFSNTLATESIGGNAGNELVDGKRYSCAAVNGFAQKESGLFVTFGNFQNVDPAIVNNPANDEISVIVGYHFGDRGFAGDIESRVLDFATSPYHEFGPHALDAMLGAVALFNEFKDGRG
jgi:hypothetical protein